MSDLSPELMQLVLAGKNASRPSDADSARVMWALRARLGDAAMLGVGAGQVAAGSSTTALFGNVAGAGIVGLALLGGIMFFAAHNHRAAPGESMAASSAAATTSGEAALIPSTAESIAPVSPELDPTAAPSATKVDRTDARLVPSRRTHDNLSEEVAILSRAETELHSGKPDAALKLLNEHERKFSNGLLAEERIAARVQSLCALGRTAEAETQLARLPPTSLHGERARQACNSRTWWTRPFGPK